MGNPADHCKDHPAVQYAKWAVLKKNRDVPVYVKKQCADFLRTAKGENPLYKINWEKAAAVERLLGLMIMPKGLRAGKNLAECTAGFQWFFYIAVLCTVWKDNPQKRRYQTALLEICRKNGKTFLVAVMFLLLFLTEPRFSEFYSVAPDGALSRLVKNAIQEIIKTSPALQGMVQGKPKFRMLRDKTICTLTESTYIPLNYSDSTLDGRMPNAFLADEVGALPNNYAVEAMRSGQINILNKLGCIISTKYPTYDNPLEEEVSHAKKVLDGLIEDPAYFALLYEPDNPKGWETDDKILRQANPLALEIPEIMETLKSLRGTAIEIPKKRINFLTKHCNIIYQGGQLESYVSLEDVRRGKRQKIDWRGRSVYVGVDLAETTDNCAVAMISYDEETEEILAEAFAFIPEGRVEEKTARERIDYHAFLLTGKCIACGDRVVDYSVIERFVLELEARYEVTIEKIGFDRRNAMSSAQKWDGQYLTVEVEQHSRTLHSAIKLLAEKITNGDFVYEENRLLEINFENARCTFDTNMNRYLNKKKSAGKIDMVMALVDAVYLMQADLLTSTYDFIMQTG